MSNRVNDVLELPAEGNPNEFYYVLIDGRAEAYRAGNDGVLRPITNTGVIQEVLAEAGVTEKVVNETVNGLVNGSNANFTTDHDFLPESVEVFLMGVKLSVTDDFTTSGTTNIHMVVSPKTGEKITVNYTKV